MHLHVRLAFLAIFAFHSGTAGLPRPPVTGSTDHTGLGLTIETNPKAESVTTGVAAAPFARDLNQKASDVTGLNADAPDRPVDVTLSYVEKSDVSVLSVQILSGRLTQEGDGADGGADSEAKGGQAGRVVMIIGLVLLSLWACIGLFVCFCWRGRSSDRSNISFTTLSPSAV